jgi:hypothetical protein
MERAKLLVLVGILIALFILAFKPSSQTYTYPPQDSPSVSVVQLSPDNLAVVDTGITSGSFGEMFVFNYNEKNHTFSYISNFNYSDYFRNPQKYSD